MDKQHAAPTRIDLAVVTMICFGLFVFSSLSAVSQGLPTYNITDDELAETIITELGMTVFALAYLRVRRQPLRALFPAPSLRGTLIGGGLFLLILLLATALQSVLALGMPDLRESREVLQVAASPAMIVAVGLVNGTYEEVFLLGFLQRHLARAGGNFAVGAVLLLRLSYHLYQGPGGAAFIVAFGGVLGFYYLKTGKLWPVVVAHILDDIVGLSAG